MMAILVWASLFWPRRRSLSYSIIPIIVGQIIHGLFCDDSSLEVYVDSEDCLERVLDSGG